MDNVEDTDHMDDYIEKFSRLELDISRIRDSVNTIVMTSNVNDRKAHETVKIISAQQKSIEDMYYLLVEMNNIFGQREGSPGK